MLSHYTCLDVKHFLFCFFIKLRDNKLFVPYNVGPDKDRSPTNIPTLKNPDKLGRSFRQSILDPHKSRSIYSTRIIPGNTKCASVDIWID